jgi:nicotinamide riboside transporter PnuC
MDRETIVKTAAVEGAKAAPPVTVVAANVASGWTMTHTATALTILYVLLQAAYLLWRWRNEREDRRTRQAEAAARQKAAASDTGAVP